ncbi:Signal transduction histidine kinase [Halovenus aranensis]|uniref:histidine kinase n=1 Tax=Halovenus aranensis TaxID=890420 RepID=A0A1G8SAE3_9EURY|nr:HAMP domain-containing sensor histidine kinase [Halovenus aranensis]SDJ26189.1 Signal transduction histidine kinase [Halovenus aranensis]
MTKREFRAPGTPTQQGYLGLALVVGTGLATSWFALSHAAQTQFGAVEAAYVFTPVVVSIALVVTGLLLWTADFDGPEMLRIGAGVFAGMITFGLLVTWTVTHEFIRGDSLAHAPFVTVNSMSVGGFVGLVLGWLDARNRRYEAKLREERNKFKRQTEELDEFAAIVSHDLRNPLNVATLEVERAKTTAADDTAQTLADVSESLSRMERIVDDVLTMAREGNAIGDLTATSVEEVAKYCWGNVETGPATLQVLDSTTVMADRSALEHVFENLFRNAVEHGNKDSTATETDSSATTPRPQDEKLTVRVGTIEGGFYVEDTGVGIPRDLQSSIFESSVTTRANGTGFGLSIVQKLAAAHGWTVRATDSDDGGARFEFTEVERAVEPSEESWLADLD